VARWPENPCSENSCYDAVGYELSVYNWNVGHCIDELTEDQKADFGINTKDEEGSVTASHLISLVT
jgi:hypothetical protein